MAKTFPLEPDLDPLTVEQQTARNKGREVDLRAENARLQERVAVAKRLLNFTPDQLDLLVDPEKLAYVTWNLSCTYTLQLMCKTYREGKMEVRRLQEQVDTATTTGLRVMKERDGFKALAKVRREALERERDHWRAALVAFKGNDTVDIDYASALRAESHLTRVIAMTPEEALAKED